MRGQQWPRPEEVQWWQQARFPSWAASLYHLEETDKTEADDKQSMAGQGSQPACLCPVFGGCHTAFWCLGGSVTGD